ncbi:MAG: ATP-dependent RecD-like DNA helicase [Candidatus Dependentiae bacterium]|nr:ATP-dependent RecD-like DNA helicase [Candidatus Dependentiae bacterium]
MNETDLLSGTVEKILFQNTENGFTVLLLTRTANNSVTVKGYLPAIHPGEQIQVSGSWIMHPKFGKQFEAKSCTAQVPTSILGLKKYLASGLIKGIGPVYAEKLVSYFGEQVLTIIDEFPSRLQEVPGIGAKRVDTIISAWKDQKEISHIMVFLQEKNISPAYAAKIYKKYGNDSIAVVIENPYRLADEIWGIGFKVADQIALNMGFALDSIKRIKSGILFCLSTIIQNGHLYIEVDELKKNTTELLGLDQPTTPLKNALHDLYNTQKISLVSHNDAHYVALTRYYFAEKGVAYKIKKLLEMPPEHQFDINTIYQSMRENQQDTISLNEAQQAGIISCLQHKITIITGGPGTGKTTLIKTLLSILDENGQTYKLAAPTGRAAKRIHEGTGRYAETLHRLLEFDVSTMNFTKNEQNAIKTHFLIIDEASMIDIFLANAVLKAMPFNAHLILIGDINQLPSVGAGNFLSDVIASNSVPCIRLSTIFRQAQNSLIIINAHKINNGEFPASSLPDTRRDFLYIKEQEPENVRAHLEHIIKKGLATFGLKPEDMIVLVPMNRGSVGTQKINYDLQQILNAREKDHVLHAGVMFKVDDRVMQIRNNYDKNVFNGDIGTIENVDKKDHLLHVRYPDKTVEYEFTELDELVLAYAISIHKSQGSEYPAVIIPLFMQHFMLLQRNLLYTAITRAKKLCILIGEPKAIAMSVNNDKGLVRTTFLKEYLTSDLECR